MIKAILFDMGNVLVFFSHERMCQQLADVCGCDTEQIRRLLLDEGLQWEFERGRLDEAGFYDRLQSHFDKPLSLEALYRAGSDIFSPNTEIVPLIQRVKQLGLRLVLLSNTCVSHMRFVRENFDFLPYFDDFVLSCEVGAIKPDREIFEAALCSAGCQPHECFFTDDLPANLQAGLDFGFRGSLYTGVPSLTQALRQHHVDV